MLTTLIHIAIGFYVFLLVFRMFVSERDAYFNPLFRGIYRATDPVMKPLYKLVRRKPVDSGAADFLTLIPIFLLILLQGILDGILTPGLSVPEAIIVSFTLFFNAAFQFYVVLILIFSVFYKFSRYPANPFIRTGFKIMEPVYVFIGRFLPPLKKYPGAAAFVLGFIVHFAISAGFYFILFSILVNEPVGVPHWAIMGLGATLTALLSLVKFFSWMVIISALMSWISPDPVNPVVQLIRLLSEPINAPFRKIIPLIGGIDISPIFSILVLQAVAVYGTRLLAAMMLALR